MPACQHMLTKTGLVCKNSAMEGCNYCRVHAKLYVTPTTSEVTPMEETSESNVELPLPPLPLIPPPPPAVIAQVYTTPLPAISQVSVPSIAPPMSSVSSEVTTAMSMIEMMMSSLISRIESIVIAPRQQKTKDNTKAIERKARYLYYHDFKKDEGIVKSIKNAAISSGVIAATDTLPWMNIKCVSDKYYNGLTVEQKVAYMNKAALELNV